MFDRGLQGRVAVVTGAVRGIGRSCAIALADEGVNVALFDVDATDSSTVSELLRGMNARGAQCIYCRADVTNSTEVESAMRRTVSVLGEVDILVNNAGKGRPPSALEELSEELWDEVVALNLKGQMLCARAVVASMKSRGWGRIVNISSIAARGRGQLPNIAYASAKAGVLGFTKQLAVQLGPHGITVNAVAPGGILSGRVVGRWASKSDAEKAQILDAIPLRRIGDPVEVARAVVFLASNDASYITGITLDVNGGRYF
jgi:3-oxoacyl-[acyl-carrier protein] reductase